MEIKKFVLPNYSYDLLARIMKNKSFKDFYLAGGTALALQLGHRESIDLDFFTPTDFEVNILKELREDYLSIISNRNSIMLSIENTKISFLNWAFPVTMKFVISDGIRLLNPIDIGLFKLLALQGRTTKKDIIDLYFIDKEIISITELLKLFEKHYPKESFNIYNSAKELFDEEKLAIDPMPKVYSEIDFEECLKAVQSKIAQSLKDLITK